MIPPINATGSAVRAFSKGFEVSAHNVANALTPGFRPVEAVYEESPQGGVNVEVKAQESAEGTDIAEESVNMVVTNAALKSNLQMLKTSQRMTGMLIDTLA